MISRSIEKRLNKHITTILIGGIFLTFSVVLVLSMCNIQGCHDQTYSINDRHAQHSNSKDSWQKSFLEPVKEFSAKLVVIIISGPNNTRQRDIIRETWLNDSSIKSHIIWRFVIGVANMPKELRKYLDRESFIRHDLLLLEDHEESYQSLANKVLQSFSWVDHHVNFEFVLKVDDDSFVRLDKMINELKSKPKEHLYWGFFDGRAHVKKRGKWSEPDWILCDRYLPYALGGGYVISSDLVHFIVSNGPILKKFNSEDVSVGAWLGPLDIQRIHDPRFDTEYVSRGCQNVYIITHKKSIIDMRELHKNLKTTGKLCSKERLIRKSYVYNWNVLPTGCCIRNNTQIP
ncbi:hypothetical protein SNE40_013971 [Patella caerulea]|uniref:Hexosyltransferase n=1 Tax=Patella caerulea TaxID=87958 RepID=A0AAN8JKC5_PATCE